MPYIISEDTKDLLSAVKEFCDNEVKEQCKEYDVTGEWPKEIYDQAIEMELHLLELPEELGGMGLDDVSAAALYEEMAKADAGFATTLVASNLGLKPILIAGNDEQKQQFADVLTGGGYIGFAITEPNGGSDVSNTKTTAVYDATTDEYVLNGRKCFITNGGIADIYFVTAVTDKTKGLKGLSGFVVERNRQGVSTGNHENKMGIRLSNTCDVILEDVRIPAKNLVGKEGEGFKIAMKTLDASRPYIGCLAVGIAQRALDEAVAYTKERVVFGSSVASKQGMQFKLADMDIQIETARQMVAHALTLKTNGQPYSREAAIAKCYAGDISVQVCLEAIQALGGYGYSREYPVEKLLRDAKIFQIFEGTNEIQRVVVANNLLR